MDRIVCATAIALPVPRTTRSRQPVLDPARSTLTMQTEAFPIQLAAQGSFTVIHYKHTKIRAPEGGPSWTVTTDGRSPRLGEATTPRAASSRDS